LLKKKNNKRNNSGIPGNNRKGKEMRMTEKQKNKRDRGMGIKRERINQASRNGTAERG